MTYRTTKCPYCKFTLDYRAAAPLPDFMPSLLPCPKCGNIYATGKKLYCEMTKNEKDKTFKKFCGKLSYLYLIKDIWPIIGLISLFGYGIVYSTK